MLTPMRVICPGEANKDVSSPPGAERGPFTGRLFYAFVGTEEGQSVLALALS